jgi:hypothetical protein
LWEKRYFAVNVYSNLFREGVEVMKSFVGAFHWGRFEYELNVVEEMICGKFLKDFLEGGGSHEAVGGCIPS